MPPTANPETDLFQGTGITAAGGCPISQAEDIGEVDAISELVGGRVAYLESWTAEDCLLPAHENERAEARQFDRYYFASDGQEAVLVDALPGGSEVEVAQQEADRQVALKRKWAEGRGVRYIVFVDPLLAAFS